MPELILEGHEEQVPIPDGEILTALVTSVVEAKKTYRPEEGEKDILKFKFQITEEGQFRGRYLSADVARWFSTDPRCRLSAWVLAILDTDTLPVDFKLNTDVLINMPCRIVVSARPYQAKNNTMQTWNGVSDVMPVRSQHSSYDEF